MQTATFNPTLTITEIENRLSGFDNFDIKERSDEELKASVGSEAKYRIIGSWVTQDYQAPIVIDVTENGDGTSTVELSRRPVLFTTAKDNEFFEEGFARIEQALKG